MNPTISIIVPCYNQAQYLPETIQSVIDQDYTNWECIIVNDGSSDNTEEVAKQWVAKDNRIKYFYKPNSGVSDTRNFGIKHASGEYLLPLDGDDKIGTKYISEALDVFTNNPNVKLVYSNLVLFGAKNQEVKTPDYRYENQFIENQIFCSAIFRRSDFLKTSGYNPNMATGLEDWDFLFSFLKKDDIVIKLDGFHFFYRIKDVSRSTQIDYNKNEKLLLQIFKNHIPLFLEYMNPIRDHIEADYYKKEVESYKTCAEYKVGSVILLPFRLTAKVFRKVAGK